MAYPIIKDGSTVCLSSLNGTDKRFKVINNGPTEAVVSATLALPVGLTVSTYTASQGTFDSGTGIWSVGALAANGSATIDFCLTIADSCELPALVTLTVNNDSCVESETGDNVGSRTISGVTCCDIIDCLGTIDFILEGDTTSTIGNNTLGTFTPVEGETIHFWSSDGSLDLALAAAVGGGTIDLSVPVSSDAGQLLTSGADGKHFINVATIVTALESDGELGRLYLLDESGSASGIVGANPVNAPADPVENSVAVEFFSDIDRYWTFASATWTHVIDRSKEFTFTDGTSPFSSQLGDTITIDSPDDSIEVDTSVADTISLNVKEYYGSVVHSGYSTTVVTGDSDDFFVVPAAMNGWQLSDVTLSSAGGTGTQSARLLYNGVAIGSLQNLQDADTKTELGINQALVTGDRIQVTTTVSVGTPEGLSATFKIVKP